MKKIDRIKKSEEFDLIIKTGKSIKNKYYVIYFTDKNKDLTRFGIAVGTKVGNAVTRNKLKRQVKSIIRDNRIEFKKDKDYIIMVRKECLKLNYKQLNDNLISIL